MSDVYEGPVCLGKEWGSGHIDKGRHPVYPTEYIYKYFPHRWKNRLELQISA